MSIALGQRQLMVLAVAMLAAVLGLAIASRQGNDAESTSLRPQPAVGEASGWSAALAGVRSRALAGRVSGCGTLLKPKTLGVDHPVLPCGAKVFVAYNGKTVLTSVVDRGPFTPREDFEVTPALADVLGLSGVQTIRWSFARTR